MSLFILVVCEHVLVVHVADVVVVVVFANEVVVISATPFLIDSPPADTWTTKTLTHFIKNG